MKSYYAIYEREGDGRWTVKVPEVPDVTRMGEPSNKHGSASGRLWVSSWTMLTVRRSSTRFACRQM